MIDRIVLAVTASLILVMLAGCERELDLQNMDRVCRLKDVVLAFDVDGYEYCGSEETCDGPKRKGDSIWCQNTDACLQTEGAADECRCHLFKAKKNVVPRKYSFEGLPMEKKDYDPDYKYACWCAKKT